MKTSTWEKSSKDYKKNKDVLLYPFVRLRLSEPSLADNWMDGLG